VDHPWLLLVNAGVLGFNHGIDWDHIAAIMDIVGTATAEDNKNLPVHRRPLALSLMYAFGHCTVVAFLGVCALYFAAVLPAWIDPFMERLVGCTLILMGVWVCVSLLRHSQGKEEFRFQSRWMLVLALAANARMWLWSKFTRRKISNSLNVREYGSRTAFGVGMIHGIGAETGTQVLLMAALGGAASQGLGAAMLSSFVTGLLISNTLVAILGTTSIITSRAIKSLYLTAGALTCLFSLVIGTFFVLGLGQQLPGLKQLLGIA
jgi:high-affinity nickel permease